MTLHSTRPARMVHQSARTGNRDYFAQPMQGRGRSAHAYGQHVPFGKSESLYPIFTWHRVCTAFTLLLCIAAVVIAIGSYAS